MNCAQIPPGSHWDALPEDVRFQCRLHAQTCSACRSRLLFEAPDALLFQVVEPPMPEAFWFGFWPSLKKKLQQPESGADVSSPYVRLGRWAAVFVVVFVVSLYEPPRSIESPVVSQKSAVAVDEYPLVEEVEGAQVTYYIFQPASNEKIVMIFDPDMEL